MAPDPKRNKEAEEARLRALQMADLGTARREYISTTDDTRQLIAAMDEIERRRHSNIAGTVEQRRAQQNQASLSAWSNFHRTANDTGRMEQLDDLMHGQSHRAQLNATLHGNEAARRPAGGHARARSFSHLPAHHHHPYAQPSSGRGGGVIGTRSRHPGSPIRNATHVGAHSQAFEGPARRDPALDSNNPDDPASRPTRGRGARRRHSSRDTHATPRARLPEIRPRRPAPAPAPIENYAKRLTNPADFLANARASFPLPAVSSGVSSSLPPKPPTAPKAIASKPAMTPNRATTAKPPTAPNAMTPKPTMARNPAIAPKPVMTSQSVMAPKPATDPKAVQKSSLADSMFATPASSTPVASATHNVPGSSTPSRRIVPLERTAGFSSRAKAARPRPSDAPEPADESNPIDERQKEKEREEQAAILLDIDQDEEASAETETQMRNLLLTPGMAELTGITFPTEDESHLLASADTQEHIARQLVQLIGYIQDRVGSSQAAHPHGERLGSVTATSLVVIEAIAKKVVEEWSQKRLAALKPPEAEAAPGPSTPASGQDQRYALRNTESMAPELKTDQLGTTSIFDNYRTPPRSASATVTDSSDEKKQRNIDAASFLSPKKREVSSELPAIDFESLRVSEGGNIRTTSGDPLSLMDMDRNLTPSRQMITKSGTKPPILGSMESSSFATPANAPSQLNKAKAGTTSQENTTISKAPRDASVSQAIVRSEGPSGSVSEAQWPTLVQSSSNIRGETSVREASPRAESSSPPREMKSRVLSGGIEHSRWADPALLSPAPSSQPQAQAQQRPRTELMSSSHSSTEDSPKPKVTFLGPLPYMPKRK